MKAEIGTTGIALAMAILLCLLVGGSVAIYPGWVEVWEFMNKNLLLTQEAPAWIQAVGSIAALVGIWWQTNRNYENNAKDRRVDLYGRQLEIMHGIELLAKRAERYLNANSKFILGENVFLENSENVKYKILISKKLENFEGEFKRFSCVDSGDTDTENFMAEISDEIGSLLVKLNNNFQISDIDKSMVTIIGKIRVVRGGMIYKKRALKDILGYKN